MSNPRNVQIEVGAANPPDGVTFTPAGNDESTYQINLFELAGVDCIVKYTVDAIGLQAGQAASFNGNPWANTEPFTLTHAESTSKEIGDFLTCCWSKLLSGTYKIAGTAPNGVTLDFGVWGTTVDCYPTTGVESSSSFGKWVACDVMESSSSGG